MPKSRKRPKSKLMPSGWEVMAALLARHGSLRPEATLGACLRNGLAAYAEQSKALPDGLNHFPLNLTLLAQTAILGWELDPAWGNEDDNLFGVAFRAVYTQLQARPLAPPRFPNAWNGIETEIVLWAHLDYLGWRGVACLGEEGAFESPLDGPYLQAQIQGMRLLAGALRIQETDPSEAHAFDTRGLLRDFQELLAEGHRWITRGKALDHWPEPVWPAFPPRTYGPKEAEAAYLKLGLIRPFDSAVEWIRLHVHLRMTLDSEWAWVPSLEGREMAISIFDGPLESSEANLWDEATTILRVDLVEAMYETLQGAAPSLAPSLETLRGADTQAQEPPRAAMDHLDRLYAAYLALVLEGWLPSEASSARSLDGEPLETFLEGLTLLASMLGQWCDAPADVRQGMARTFLPLVAGQHLLLQEHLAKLPESARAYLSPVDGVNEAAMAEIQRAAEES